MNFQNEINFKYDIQLKIGDIDISKYVYKVEVLSSINFIMNMYMIGLNIDSSDLIINKIYGQQNARLSITLTTENRGFYEFFEVNLMIVKLDLPVNTHVMTDLESNNKTPPLINTTQTTMICCQKEAFETMYTTVNKLIENENGLTPIDAVKEIVDEFLKIDTYIIDDKNINQNELKQLMIPPCKFINSIRYIDSKYPLYKGNKNLYFYRSDDNQLCIWNLRNRLLAPPDYKVVLLTANTPDSAPLGIKETPGTEELPIYWAYGDIKTSMNANSNLAFSSYKNSFITHPEDTLYNKIDIELENVYNENSLVDTNNRSIYFNDTLKGLSKYTVLSSSDYEKELSQKFINDNFTSLTNITLKLSGGNMFFKKLMRPGVSVFIECIRTLLLDYNGKYIVNKSILLFERFTNSPHYHSNCFINVIRDFYE